MTARLLVAALFVVALATQPVAFDLLGLKRAAFFACAALLLLARPLQAALVRTVGGATRLWVLTAGGFALAAAVAIGGRGVGGGGSAQELVVARAVLELLLFVLVIVLAREVAWERGATLLRGIVALGFVIAAIAIAQACGLDPIYGEDSPRVPVATFGNTNPFGAFAAPCLAVAAVRATRPRAFFAWTAAALLAAALVLARSRGAWVAAAVGLAPLVVAALRGGGEQGARRVLAIVVAGALAGIALDRFAARGEDLASKPLGLGLERSSNLVRLDVARATLRLAAEHPIAGVGPGRFRDEYPSFRLEREALTPTREGAASEVDHPHDEPLRLLAEGGAVTLGLALLATIATLLVLARNARAVREDDGARAAITSGLVAWLAASLFWSTLYDPATALLGAVLFGAALAGEPEMAASKPRERWLARLFTAGLLVASAAIAAPALLAELADWRAARDGRLDAADLDALERAAGLDSLNVERQYAIGRQFLAAAQSPGADADRELRRARERFERALALVPRHAASLESLAEVAARSGDEAAARRALARLHALEPWRGGVDEALFATMAAAGRELAAARVRLEREGQAAIAPLFAQAKALRASGRNRPAAQVLDLLAQHAPEDAELLRELALALQDLGDEAGYRAAYRRSQIAFALAALADGRSEEARANLAVARRFASDQPGATTLEELLEACVDLQRNRLDAARGRLATLDSAAAFAAAREAPATAATFLRMLAKQPALRDEAARLGLDG